MIFYLHKVAAFNKKMHYISFEKNYIIRVPADSLIHFLNELFILRKKKKLRALNMTQEEFEK